MTSVRRLILLMLFGAFVGYVFIGEMLVSRFYGYRHGFGDGEKCDLAGSVIGAMLGVGLELIVRLCRLRSTKFSISQLMILTALLAFVLGGVVPIVEWAKWKVEKPPEQQRQTITKLSFRNTYHRSYPCCLHS